MPKAQVNLSAPASSTGIMQKITRPLDAKTRHNLYRLTCTSVDTDMCCPKGKCGCQYFILLTLKKKNRGHRGPGFFNKKLILDNYFFFKSGPVFLFQIFYLK
jgi:hypothetical protein